MSKDWSRRPVTDSANSFVVFAPLRLMASLAVGVKVTMPLRMWRFRSVMSVWVAPCHVGGMASSLPSPGLRSSDDHAPWSWKRLLL